MSAVLRNLRLAATRAVFLGIALFPDSFGPRVIGAPLHLTVQHVDWWREHIAAAGLGIISGAVLRNQEEAPMWLYLHCRPQIAS